MFPFLFRRLLTTLLSLWLVVTLTFAIMKLIPGNPFLDPKVPPAVQESLQLLYGLEKPLLEQYFHYWQNVFKGNLGVSLYHQGHSVASIISDSFAVSATVGLSALFFSLALGIPLGLMAAINARRPVGLFFSFLIAIGVGIPNFVLGGLLQYFMAWRWGLLPAARWGGPAHMLLPALTLGCGGAAILARLVCGGTLEVFEQPFIRTALAKGLRKGEILYRHILPNALLPALTTLGTLTAALVMGSFAVEQIFALPGLGSFFVQSIYNRDYPVILGLTIFYATLILGLNFLVDLAYGLLDPRIRLFHRQD